MGVAKDEREQLCDLFTEVGPDQPTLCGQWLTKDLAAHLVVRERRLDAAPGILLAPLAGYTQRVQDSYASKPWAELVDLVRTGPPRYSPVAIGPVDELVNSGEFLVHHEDVRRGKPGWEPRPADEARDRSAWAGAVRVAKMTLRKSSVGVVLRTPAGAEVTAKAGADPVVVLGEPVELLLYVFGRDESRVDLAGDASAVTALRGLSRGF